MDKFLIRKKSETNREDSGEPYEENGPDRKKQKVDHSMEDEHGELQADEDDDIPFYALDGVHGDQIIASQSEPPEAEPKNPSADHSQNAHSGSSSQKETTAEGPTGIYH